MIHGSKAPWTQLHTTHFLDTTVNRAPAFLSKLYSRNRDTPNWGSWPVCKLIFCSEKKERKNQCHFLSIINTTYYFPGFLSTALTLSFMKQVLVYKLYCLLSKCQMAAHFQRTAKCLPWQRSALRTRLSCHRPAFYHTFSQLSLTNNLMLLRITSILLLNFQ